jgi:hypothetical protein
MKYILLFTIVIIPFFSCRGKNSVLKSYYNDNIQLHQVLADSLMSFAKGYHTEVVLRRRLDMNEQIIFSYSVKTDEPLRIGIEFDSALKRTDNYPEITSKTLVPIEIIKLFKKTMYTSLIADSTEVFFGYKDSFDGNSKYGILINRDTAGKSKYHKLAKDVYLTWGIIP